MKKDLNSPQLEACILGAILRNNKDVEGVSEELFTASFHQQCFKAIQDIINQGGTANIVTVSEKMGKEFSSRVAQLTDSPYSDVPYDIGILKELTVKRNIYQFIKGIANGLGEKESKEIIGELDLFSLTLHEKRQSGTRHISALLIPAIDSIEQDITRNGLRGLPSGFETFDKMTDGFHPGELIIIGARPGTGKTSIALNIMTAMLRIKKSVLFFSAEMSSEMIIRRVLSSNSLIDSTRIRRGFITHSEFKIIFETASELREQKLFLNDTPNISLSDLRVEARRFRKAEKIDCVILDYIGLVENFRKDVPRHEQISEISRSLKALARELEVPVIALSQLNRTAQDKRPNLAQLRDSGAIEQDADLVALLWEKGNHKSDQGKKEITLSIEKNRHGGCGEIALVFQTAYTRFSELANMKE
jgi:replicative DNA helicase